MLTIKNMGPIAFREYIREKHIFIFGAGRALESSLDIYFENKTIDKIADNKESLWGHSIEHNENKVEITNADGLVSAIKKVGLSDSVLFITSPFYAADIVEQLDSYKELDGLECFMQVLIRNTKEKTGDFVFSAGNMLIPKKIHYIWFGGKELPDEFQKNIDSWRRINPDYEIIRWDESNYDFDKCAFLKEAYEADAWGFASNYARLDIIYNHGGIYLDTDVQCIKKLDCLLNDQAFFCMGNADRVNNGCGFGAIAGHGIVSDMIKEYESVTFDSGKGGVGKRPGHTFLHPALRKYGFDINNYYQNIDGVALYPKEVMSPLTIAGMDDFTSEKTVSIHFEDGSWKNQKEKEGMLKLQKLIKDRLYE